MKQKTFNLKLFLTIILVVAVLAVSIVLIVLNSKLATTAVVYVNGEVVETLNLSEDKTVEIQSENGYNIVKVKNHKVCVLEADCPGGDCVLTGYINRVGQTIICLPHKLVVELKK